MARQSGGTEERINMRKWAVCAVLAVLFAAVVIFNSQPASAVKCNKWSSSATFDSGDDGCFTWCVNGTPFKRWCAGAHWTSLAVTYSCVPDPDECANPPCQVDSRQNGTWEICDCLIQCPVGQHQEEGHFWEGSWVFCLVCP